MSAQTAARPTPWIVSARYDLLFFVGTPLLCLAAFLPLRGVFPSLSIYIAVMAFSSFGHHLPGFLRAYGDKELFGRFRARFLLAPPLLFGTFLWFGMNDMQGMLLVLMLWSVWHVMMQHFGFMRIYDAKVGQTAPLTAWLDRLLSLLWFVSIVLWSPEYTHNFVATFYDSGGALLPPAVFDAVRTTVWGATGVVTLLYIGNTARLLARGEPVSRVKLVLLVTTLGFLWFVWVGLHDLFLGLAIWEVFHDIQYFAITWIYNRRLVEKGFGSTRFMSYLFRRRAPMVALYVGAIAVYGGVNWVIVTETTATLNTVLMAFVFTSTLLHYYYDGFIWKVRHERTRAGLDLEGAPAAKVRLPRGVRSAVVQVLGFAVPIGTLAAMELNAPAVDPVALRENVAALAPRAGDSHLNAGRAYSDAGRVEDAVAAYARALELAPDDPRAHGGYATALLEQGGEGATAAADEHLTRARALDPADDVYAVNLALLRHGQGRTDEAVALFEEAVAGQPDWQPRTPSELLLQGHARLQRQDLAGALASYDEVLHHDPGNLDALTSLAFVSTRLGQTDRADAVLEQLVGLAAEPYPFEVARIQNLLAGGQTARAVALLRVHVEAYPEDYDRKLSLAEVLAVSADPRLRDGAEAVRLAEEVVAVTQGKNVGALDILGAAHAEAGDFAAAVAAAEKALAEAERQHLTPLVEQIRARRALYAAGRPYHLGG